MLIQDIVPPNQVVLLREIFIEVPVRAKQAATLTKTTLSKPHTAVKSRVKLHTTSKKSHKTKVKVH